jgi:CheY-specific phosphatase CheX
MDMSKTSSSAIAKIFAHVIQELLQKTTGKKFHISTTILQIPNIKLSGDISSFVTFYGDYNGLMVFNFEGAAALEVVNSMLLGMGLGEEDLPKHSTSDEVRNNIGEFTNQSIGKIRSTIQLKYDIAAKANIPAVVPITVPLSITMETKGHSDMDCIRIVFTTEKNNRFHMELAIEPMVWQPLMDSKSGNL